jgi:hypothetical protein
MRRPGERLKRLASRVCSPETMRRIVEPAIADLQLEHAHAVARGRAFAALVYARSVVACGMAIASAWCASDERALTRLVAWTLAITTAVTSLMIWMPFLQVASRVPEGDAWLVLLLLVVLTVPAMLPTTMPCAVAIVARSADPSRRLKRVTFVVAVACAATTLLMVAAVLPAASQMFRDVFAGQTTRRGVNELSLVGMWRAHAWLQLNGRAALVCAPLVLTAFVWRTLAWQRNAIGSALAISGIVLYNVAYVALPRLWPSLMPGVAVGWSVWLPDALFLAVAIMPRRDQTVHG